MILIYTELQTVQYNQIPPLKKYMKLKQNLTVITITNTTHLLCLQKKQFLFKKFL